MNIIIIPETPAPEPSIELSETGELIMLGIIAAATVGFFGIVYKTLKDDAGPRIKKSHFWNR